MDAHTPVMAERVAGLLVPAPGPLLLVDCTLGAGGHAEHLLLAGGEDARLIGIDRDDDALALARERLARFGDRARLVKGDFAELEEMVSGNGPVDGVLYDLGVSSMQLDRAERGFSYRADAPLDMRMDRAQPLTAGNVVNTYPERDLARVIRDYGEERWASRIAKFIVQARQRMPLSTTGDLVDVVRSAVPAAARREGPHPARRTFQALRIEVNRELASLESSLPQAAAVLRPGGRVVALSYHSLEDRIVKDAFRREANGEAPRLRVLTRRPVRPDEAEVRANPRASAAKLRAAERLAAPPLPPEPPDGRAA